MKRLTQKDKMLIIDMFTHYAKKYSKNQAAYKAIKTVRPDCLTEEGEILLTTKQYNKIFNPEF